MPAIHDAARNGDLDQVRSLVEELGVNIVNDHSQAHYEMTPLHFASDNGHLPVVQFLMESGADVNDRDRWGQTPVHFASGKGHLPIVQHLMEHGADIHDRNVLEMTPLHIASKQGHLSIVQHLVEHGADVSAQECDGNTALHLARSRDHTAVVHYLKHTVKVRRCHSLIQYLAENGFWNNQKTLKRK